MMNKYFMCALILFGTFSTPSYAKIQQAVCVSGIINTTILSDKGKWIGASVMDSNGNIEDIPPQKHKLTIINYNFRYSSKAKKFRVSTWKKYDGSLMDGRISDTNWKSCN